jgi:hypothetical protein
MKMELVPALVVAGYSLRIGVAAASHSVVVALHGTVASLGDHTQGFVDSRMLAHHTDMIHTLFAEVQRAGIGKRAWEGPDCSRLLDSRIRHHRHNWAAVL